MFIKKLMSIVCAFLITLTLCGCGRSKEDGVSDEEAKTFIAQVLKISESEIVNFSLYNKKISENSEEAKFSFKYSSSIGAESDIVGYVDATYYTDNGWQIATINLGDSSLIGNSHWECNLNENFKNELYNLANENIGIGIENLDLTNSYFDLDDTSSYVYKNNYVKKLYIIFKIKDGNGGYVKNKTWGIDKTYWITYIEDSDGSFVFDNFYESR